MSDQFIYNGKRYVCAEETGAVENLNRLICHKDETIKFLKMEIIALKQELLEWTQKKSK